MMPNEILIIISFLIIYGGVMLFYRFFGKNGLIAPTDYTTRAEVAVLIKRILDYKGK